jgi:hypothetical protein
MLIFLWFVSDYTIDIDGPQDSIDPDQGDGDAGIAICRALEMAQC